MGPRGSVDAEAPKGLLEGARAGESPNVPKEAGEIGGNGWKVGRWGGGEGKADILAVEGLASPRKGGKEASRQEAYREWAGGRVKRGQGVVWGGGWVWPGKGRERGGKVGSEGGVRRRVAGGGGEGTQGTEAVHKKAEEAAGEAVGLCDGGDTEEASGNNSGRRESGSKEGVRRWEAWETMAEK
jgi:hypothetical protein